ncbi:hypothetical protein [Porphyrobacter sp. HT-58-2]|uniref:hypothetical protein n=1 Tax=Porphyrobacter sp. HT-58-2 TaxID=2023229 RepID=UPI0011B0C45B|nr:hypothetical protein [Porphyrobacter sp. HT-58-2]
MNDKEIMEAEAIHKEDALRRIAAMVNRYQITKADLAAILPDVMTCAPGDNQAPKSKLFVPFFDVR